MSIRNDIDSHLDDDLSYMVSLDGEDKDEEEGETKALLMKVMNENIANRRALNEQEKRHQEQIKRLEKAISLMSIQPRRTSILRSSAMTMNSFPDDKEEGAQEDNLGGPNPQLRTSFHDDAVSELDQHTRTSFSRSSLTRTKSYRKNDQAIDEIKPRGLQDDTFREAFPFSKTNILRMSTANIESFDDEGQRLFTNDEEENADDTNVKETVKMRFAEDTFSIMMLSPLFSWGYFLGLITFGFQIALASDYIYSFIKFTFIKQLSEEGNKFRFNIPIGVSTSVRFGQYCVALLSIFLSSDIQIAIQYLLIFRKGSDNLQILKENQIDKAVVIPSGGLMRNTIYFPKLRIGDSKRKDQKDEWHRVGPTLSSTSLPISKMFMLRAVYFPNILRFLQGIVVIVMLMILIIQNNDFIELLMNFSALFIIAQIDDIVFTLVRRGYFFGYQISEVASKIEKMEISEERKRGRQFFNSSFFKGSVILGFISMSMIVYVYAIARLQEKGIFLQIKYPGCIVSDNADFALIGDGICQKGELNNNECGFDGGDCEEFNIKYPGCSALLPLKVGDDICDDGNNYIECQYDGGDCCPFGDPTRLDKLDDFNKLKQTQRCDGGLYSTSLCDYDAGACDSLREQFPRCDFNKIGNHFSVTDNVPTLGDTFCESTLYNNENCGWEFGDCLECNSLVTDITLTGDGYCHGGWHNSNFCNSDGNDCDAFNARYPGCTEYTNAILDERKPLKLVPVLGNGACESFLYNNKDCGYENGDCLTFNILYPECADKIKELLDSGFPRTSLPILGDGICNSGLYMLPECGFEDGECEQCSFAIEK
ncbi:hypothetical protein CTEN210_18537 [Chaetoceros tenuissimus]|uniref:LNR domain-containing protein n=1 Tax=Chaetoceros tenuissimus TaxID=426638 RepID=A0AAD3DEY4_9STRA|nr:hypothetical protein CTEN210_18537 [Chaetoceros tenuissimus]